MQLGVNRRRRSCAAVVANLGVLARRRWALLALSYAIVRAWMFAAATPVLTYDSRDYLNIAGEPLVAARFFREHKPWLAPFVYKLAGDTVARICVAQLVISVAAWLALAFVLRRSFAGRVGAAAAGGVLTLSLTPPIVQWDAVVLSESLSLSLAALLLAALLLMLRAPSSGRAALVGVTGLLWAGTRDTNMWVLAMALPLFVAVLLVRRQRRPATVLAVLLAATVGVSLWSAASPRRWELISVDLINERVLGQQPAEAFFRARGMPVSEGLRPRLFVDRVPFERYEHDPALATFRPWLRAKSKQTYIRFLLAHPGRSLGVPLARLGQLNSPDGLQWYTPKGLRWPGRGALWDALYLPSGSLVLFWSSLASLLVVALALARVVRREAVVGLACAAVTIPHAVLVWDAEPREVARHGLLVGVLDRLALLILVTTLAAALLDLRALRSGRPDRLSAAFPPDGARATA